MRKALLAAVLAVVTVSFSASAYSAYYVEYYRNNLFLGLAYHRVACLTDWSTIQSDQDYDGFSSSRYCYSGSSSDSVPGASCFDWNYATGAAQLDACGAHTNEVYDTPNYARRSNSCNYNIFTDCNSDCWMREFSTCQGYTIPIASPCF